jgi:SAM-dependent methyltransferase
VTEISYSVLPHHVDWLDHVTAVLDRSGAHRVADLGGGANPIVPLEMIAERDLDYTVFDVSSEELEKAPGGYRTVVADLGAPGFAPDGEFDLVISRWLLEHIERPAAFHRNVMETLRPGGRAAHFFPTLYSLPFLANRLLPEALTRRALRAAFPYREEEGSHGKFPARYRWCRGPTRAQLRRLESTGFVVEGYEGYFSHPYYRSVPGLRRLEGRLAEVLVRHPLPAITTFAAVVLRKPDAPQRS